MATSPEYMRPAGNVPRPLTDAIFESLREAVMVVDVRRKYLPVVMANAAARLAFLGKAAPDRSLIDTSLYSLLGPMADVTGELGLASLEVGAPAMTRLLSWRMADGERVFATELRMLSSSLAQQLVVLTFRESAAESAVHGPTLGRSIEVDSTSVDVLILDRELTVTYASAGAGQRAGSDTGSVLGYSALLLSPTSAIPRDAYRQALEGRRYYNEAVEVPRLGAPTQWFEIEVQPFEDQHSVAGVAVLSREIGEARARANMIKGSERRLSTLTEHSRDIIKIADRDGLVRYVSGGIHQSLGYSPEDRRSHSIFQLVHPDDVEALRLKYGELTAGLIHTFAHQYRVRHRDGSYHWLEASFVSALDNPLIDGVVLNASDVTDSRAVEQQLAQRKEVFQLAADVVQGILFEWDLVTGVIFHSRGVHELLGVHPDELQTVGSWSARVHPEDVQAYSTIVNRAVKSGEGWNVTYRVRDAKGRYLSVLERALIQRGPDGVPARAVGCCVDVSEIKRLTDLLAQSHRSAKLGGWEYNYQTHALEWTEGMYAIYETTPAQFPVSIEAILARCAPESRLRLNDEMRRAERADGVMDLELEIITLRQQRLWVRATGKIESVDGRPSRAFGSLQDIHAQKMAQLALEHSSDWLKMSMDMAHMHAWRWDRAGDTLEFAVPVGPLEHLPKVFPGMSKLMSRVHRSDREAVKIAVDRAFESRTEVHQEFRLRSHDGLYRAYLAVARPVFDESGQPTGLMGVTQDVTHRLQSQAMLRRSEQLLRITTSNTADTLLLLDRDLRIRFINREAAGLSTPQLVGQHVSVLLPEMAHARVTATLEEVLATGEPVTYEFKTDGEGDALRYLENRAVLVREEGMESGISITMRDITVRRRLEQQILDVSNRERQAIGRDLHDGLGQELTGVALMLRALANRIEAECPSAVEQVNEIVQLVNQSIEASRELARGLLPVNTQAGGLSCALRALAERYRDRYGFSVEFHAEMGQDTKLGETVSAHLYRIAQEALTNAVRHAHASKVTITLRVTERRYSLEVADNGGGMPKAAQVGPGMGLKIMQYRAELLGATLEIGAVQPHGTVIAIEGLRSPTGGCGKI